MVGETAIALTGADSGDRRFESATLLGVTKSVSELAALGLDVVFEPGDAGYAPEIAGFNAAVVHRPDVVVGARSTEDVVRAVRVARDRKWRVAIQGTGHGTPPVVGGLLVSQVLTLYTTPVVYLYMDRLRVWFERRRRGGAPEVSR